ncbi:MAG TPA: hypothetical protein VFK66_04480, partial [Oryzihumus sp.]|nr:hypothetical protein [Oryzihumus sp.]
MPSTDPDPHASRNDSKSIVTNSCALVCTGASPPAAAERRQASTRASPRRWSLLRRSLTPSTGFGADSGPIAASNTLA